MESFKEISNLQLMGLFLAVKMMKLVLVSPTCSDRRFDLIQLEILGNCSFTISSSLGNDSWLLKKVVSSANWMVIS